MDTQEQQNRLEKIRALLAKAESTTHAEEAKAFSAKAQELMAKWSIDDAMLEAGKEDLGQIERLDVWLDANEYRAPKVRLLSNLAAVNDCRTVLYPQLYREVDGKRKRMFRVVVVGFEKDRKFVEALFTSLLLQSEQELLSPQIFAQMEVECDQGGHRIRWRNSFMMAYANELFHILHAAKERAKQQASAQYTGGSMALVLADRSKLVLRKYEEFYPKLGKCKSSSAGQGMGSAHALGRQAAHRADVGRPKVGGNRRMIGD